MPCINCNIEFKGDFCPTCGEKKDVDRITFQSITTSVFSGFLNMDKGLLFNLKNLTIHPKKTILNYINGKRRQVLNPISYVILTISVYLFLGSILPRGERPEVSKIDLFDAQEMGMKVGYFMRDKMKFLWFTYAIYTSIFTKLIFKKYNFFEHLAINCFILGHATILAILTRLVYNREIIIFNFLVYAYISILLYKVFKDPKDAFGSAAISILVVFLSFLVFLGVPFLLVNFL
ncbi:DUF3667 domain-containing protein [Polaribacter sp. R77954]|uniref:DUF3667 domain-containing protein n=1 Tax=Polaribacter sp. R77954 TaxID=3093870 RepID=UPI0037C84E66